MSAPAPRRSPARGSTTARGHVPATRGSVERGTVGEVIMDVDLGTTNTTMDTNGPAEAIAGFKALRESKRHKTFCAILACAIVLDLVSMFGADWFGKDLWGYFYAMSVLSTSLMYVPPYKWESEWGNMSLQSPGLASMLFVGYHAYLIRMYLSTGGKYGLLNSIRWLYFVYLLATGLPSVLRGISPLSSSVDPQVSMFRRPGTATEALLVDLCLCLFQYTLLPFLMLCDGQYEFGALGYFGGVLQVLMQLGLLAWFMRHYGPMVTGQNPEPPGDTRVEMHGQIYWVASVILGLHFLLLALLGPAAEAGGVKAYLEPADLFHGHLRLSSYGNQTAPGTSPAVNEILAASFCLIPLATMFFRSAIYGVFYQFFENKQRLIDGAFIAKLMEETDQSESSSGEQFADLIAESASLVRRISSRNLSIRVLASSPRDVEGNRGLMSAEESYALGESCGLGGIDYFISHSWSDCHRQKYVQLAAVALLFYRKHRRPCSFWLDKVCINQNSIERDLRCLPIFVSSCANLLILAGESYATRLCACYTSHTSLTSHVHRLLR